MGIINANDIFKEREDERRQEARKKIRDNLGGLIQGGMDTMLKTLEEDKRKRDELKKAKDKDNKWKARVKKFCYAILTLITCATIINFILFQVWAMKTLLNNLF